MFTIGALDDHHSRYLKWSRVLKHKTQASLMSGEHILTWVFWGSWWWRRKYKERAGDLLLLTQILTMSPMLPELKPGGKYCVIFHIFLIINLLLLLVENQRKSVTWVILLALAALERRPLVRLTRLPVLLLKCWISWISILTSEKFAG